MQQNNHDIHDIDDILVVVMVKRMMIIDSNTTKDCVNDANDYYDDAMMNIMIYLPAISHSIGILKRDMK